MKPNTFAAFFTFLVTGITTLTKIDLSTYNTVSKMLIITIISSGLHYYYLSVATEQEWDLKRKSASHKISIWIITAIQYTAFTSLWTLLESKFQLRAYAFGLFVVNLTYLIWDYIHRKDIKQNNEGLAVLLLDICGILLSVFLMVAAFSLPPQEIRGNDSADKAILVTIPCILLIAHSIIGFIISLLKFKYNPFKFIDMDGYEIGRTQPPA